MKTIGLIGGTSWHSTMDYYRIINQTVHEKLGGLNSARILLYSFNFKEIRPPDDPKEWGNVTDAFVSVAKRLETGGADCIVMCANTPHLIADVIQQHISIPLINIAEVTANEIRKAQICKVALLGTKFTMEQSFFKDKLSARAIETLIPDAEEREFIHHSVFNEFGKGIFSAETKQRYLQIIERLISQGAEGIIFGCSEITLLIKAEECRVPVFDTGLLHAQAAVEFALGQDG